MALQSMTGFARREGTSGRWRWAWELRSVNGKGLDLRLRLAAGAGAPGERCSPPCRRALQPRQHAGVACPSPQPKAALKPSSIRKRSPPFSPCVTSWAVSSIRRRCRLDTLLSIRGLVDFRETRRQRGGDRRARCRYSVWPDDAALADLRTCASRRARRSARVLLGHVADDRSVDTARSRAIPRARRTRLPRRLSAQVALADGQCRRARPRPAACRGSAAGHQGGFCAKRSIA